MMAIIKARIYIDGIAIISKMPEETMRNIAKRVMNKKVTVDIVQIIRSTKHG